MPFHAQKKTSPAGDERLVELERVLFPPSTQEAQKGTIFHGPKLKATTEGAQLSQAHEIAHPSPRLASQHGSSSSKQHKKGGSHASPSRHIHAAHFGFNPLNPFESVVDATPAIRHLHPHSWRQLELALPPGCSPEVQQELKAELAQHLRSNTSLIGARVSSSPQGRPLASGAVPPLNLPPLVPNAQGALSSRIGSDIPLSPAATTNAFPSPHTGSQSARARSSLAAPPTSECWLPPISNTEQVPAKLVLPPEATAAATVGGTSASPRSCRPPNRSASAHKVEDLKSSLLAPIQQSAPQGRPKSSDAGLEKAAHDMRSAVVPAHGAEGQHSASPGTPAGGVNGPRTPLPSVPASSEGDTVGANQGGGNGAKHAHAPYSATLEPAGIGSVGPWIERRGLELGSSTQTSHTPAAPSVPTTPPTDASRAAVSEIATVSATAGGTSRGSSPGVSPLTKGAGGGHNDSRTQQPGAAYAGYGPGTTAAASALAGAALPAGNTPGGPPVTLGALVSERQSVRRQAQLIAEWLEASVARLWQQHTQQVTQLGMRAALANRHISRGEADIARPPKGPRATNSLFAGSFSKEPHVWHAPVPSASLNSPEQYGGHDSKRPMGRGQHGTQGSTVRSAELGESMPPHLPLTERSMASEVSGSVRSGETLPRKGRVPLEQGRLQPEVLGLQRVLSVLSGGADGMRKGSKTHADHTSDKENLAGRFAAFVQGSMLAAQQGDPATADASQQMWRDMLQVVSAASTALVQHVGEGCWEEGALLSHLWNLHTMLITSGMESASSCAMRAEKEVEQLQSQVKRLDPLIEWDKAAQEELVGLRASFAEQGASLHLACAERDGLLRENDKIIGHYKKELRRMRQEQRRGQWRLAKKLKNTHNQLALMQRDRQSLVDAVTYTRVQASEMVVIITNVNNQFQRLQANHAEMLETEGFSIADLLFIENGLRNMATMAKRVQEFNKEAEDQHFQTEEEVTAVIATDDVEDDEVDAIMAGGDPDKQDEPPPDLAAAQEAEAAAEREEKARLEDERKAAEEQAEQEEQERAEAEAAQKEQEAAAAAEKAAAEKAASEQATPEKADAEQETAAEQQSVPEAAAGAADPSQPPAQSGEATEEEAPKPSPSPSRASSARPSERVRQRMGSSQPSSSRASSKAASLQDASMQTLPIQPSPQEIKQEERRVQDLVRGRERKLAERLMEAFDIEMDRELLHAKRAAASPAFASPMSSRGTSRSASPDTGQRSSNTRARGAADRSRMGRMHAVDDEDPGSASRSLSSPSPESASSPKQEQASFLEMVASRIQDKMEDLQAAMEAAAQSAAQSAASSRPESPECAIVTAKLNLATQDLKSLQEQLMASTSSNRELESKLKAAQEARASAAATPRIVEDRSALSSPAEPKEGLAETEKPQVYKKPAEAKRTKTSYKQLRDPPATSRASSMSFTNKGDKSRERPWQRPSPVGSRQQKRESAASPPPPEPPKIPGPRAFVLGRERHPEQRQQGQISGAARLEDAVVRYSGIKPRTPEWLLKLIDGIYRGKIVSDEARAKMVPPQEPIPLVDYVFQHLAGVYGTSSLVNQYVAQLVSTIRANLEVDTRVRVFNHFLMEDRWPRKVLSVFLDGLRRLSEPARLPCCDFPGDWSGTKKGGHPMADVRKCLWVADKVLMRRHTRTAYTFAAALALKGEPIHELELKQYFVAPGYYGQELQQMLEYERGRAEFRKLQTHVFLEALCDEYVRCETVFSEMLPALHKKWDTNADGYLSLENVNMMMRHMAPSGMEADEIEAQIALFWQEACKLENPVDQNLAVPQTSSTSLPEGAEPSTSAVDAKHTDALIGIEAFVGAAQDNDFIRLYVRLHKTPPPKRPTSTATTAEQLARTLLLAYIQNHWKLHGASLTRLFSSTTPSVEVLLRQQVQDMLNAKDGARKAMALHKLFKLLINRRLDCMISQLPSVNTGTHEVNESFPGDLERLTRAIKVIYGAEVIIADDLHSMAEEPWDPASTKSVAGRLQLRFLGEALKTFNALRAPMRTHAVRFLCASPAFETSCRRRSFKCTSPFPKAGGHAPQVAEQRGGALGATVGTTAGATAGVTAGATSEQQEGATSVKQPEGAPGAIPAEQQEGGLSATLAEQQREALGATAAATAAATAGATAGATSAEHQEGVIGVTSAQQQEGALGATAGTTAEASSAEQHKGAPGLTSAQQQEGALGAKDGTTADATSAEQHNGAPGLTSAEQQAGALGATSAQQQGGVLGATAGATPGATSAEQHKGALASTSAEQQAGALGTTSAEHQEGALGLAQQQGGAFGATAGATVGATSAEQHKGAPGSTSAEQQAGALGTTSAEQQEGVLGTPSAEQRKGALGTTSAEQHEGVLGSTSAEQHKGVLGPTSAEQQEGAPGVPSDSAVSMPPGVHSGELSMRTVVSNSPAPSSAERPHNGEQDVALEQESVAAESSFDPPPTPKQGSNIMDSPAGQDGA